MLTAKSAEALERQKLFEQLRHFVSAKHQCPEWLTHSDLLVVIGLLAGEVQ